MLKSIINHSQQTYFWQASKICLFILNQPITATTRCVIHALLPMDKNIASSVEKVYYHQMDNVNKVAPLDPSIMTTLRSVKIVIPNAPIVLDYIWIIV